MGHVVNVERVTLLIAGIRVLPRGRWVCTCGRRGHPTREFAARAGGARHAVVANRDRG